MQDLPEVMTTKQLAALLSVGTAKLDEDRYLNRGIPYVRIGRSIRYLKADVLKFFEDNRIRTGGAA